MGAADLADSNGFSIVESKLFVEVRNQAVEEDRADVSVTLVWF